MGVKRVLVHQGFELPKKLLRMQNVLEYHRSISARSLVDQLLDRVKEIRNIEVEEVEIVKENVEFKLPKELRLN